MRRMTHSGNGDQASITFSEGRTKGFAFTGRGKVALGKAAPVCPTQSETLRPHVLEPAVDGTAGEMTRTFLSELPPGGAKADLLACTGSPMNNLRVSS